MVDDSSLSPPLHSTGAGGSSKVVGAFEGSFCSVIVPSMDIRVLKNLNLQLMARLQDPFE